MISPYALAEMVRHNRAAHFEEVFGTHYPSEKSAHVNLHAQTAHTVVHCQTQATAAGDPSPSVAELVQATARSFRDRMGRVGNVFRPGFVEELAWCVRNFLRLQQETASAEVLGNPKMTRSLAYKVTYRLHQLSHIETVPLSADGLKLGPLVWTTVRSHAQVTL